MSAFKGTKEDLERKYVSGYCIGIGTVGNYSQMTANSILPDTDEEYEKDHANMLLYSKAPKMLEMLERIAKIDGMFPNVVRNINKLIKEATEL